MSYFLSTDMTYLIYDIFILAVIINQQLLNFEVVWS